MARGSTPPYSTSNSSSLPDYRARGLCPLRNCLGDGTCPAAVPWNALSASQPRAACCALLPQSRACHSPVRSAVDQRNRDHRTVQQESESSPRQAKSGVILLPTTGSVPRTVWILRDLPAEAAARISSPRCRPSPSNALAPPGSAVCDAASFFQPCGVVKKGGHEQKRVFARCRAAW